MIVKWPNKYGGYTINKLDYVQNGERLILYEIPCDYDRKDYNLWEYSLCVQDNLNQLYDQGFISYDLKQRLFISSEADENVNYDYVEWLMFCKLCANWKYLLLPIQYYTIYYPVLIIIMMIQVWFC